MKKYILTTSNNYGVDKIPARLKLVWNNAVVML